MKLMHLIYHFNNKIIFLLKNFIKKFKNRILLIALLFALNANAGSPFIIDTDMGVDDAIAILYLLNIETIDVKLITIAATGGVHCDKAFYNVFGLLRLTHHADISVACGKNIPLSGNHHFPNWVLSESDGLAGTSIFLEKTQSKISHQAINLLIKTILQSDKPVTILAIGPLTNIAEAFKKSQRIQKKIHAIYIMGGSINAPGNLRVVDDKITNEVSEWNFYLDPAAANIVFHQNVPIVLVPLDVTNSLPIDVDFFSDFSKHYFSPAANFVFRLLNANKKMVLDKQWFFWDPLVAVIASHPSIATYERKAIEVLIEPEGVSGRTVLKDLKRSNVQIVSKINNKIFKKLLIDGLNKK